MVGIRCLSAFWGNTLAATPWSVNWWVMDRFLRRGRHPATAVPTQRPPTESLVSNTEERWTTLLLSLAEEKPTDVFMVHSLLSRLLIHDSDDMWAGCACMSCTGQTDWGAQLQLVNRRELGVTHPILTSSLANRCYDEDDGAKNIFTPYKEFGFIPSSYHKESKKLLGFCSPALIRASPVPTSGFLKTRGVGQM